MVSLDGLSLLFSQDFVVLREVDDEPAEEFLDLKSLFRVELAGQNRGEMGEEVRVLDIAFELTEEIWHGAEMASCRRFLIDYGPEQGGRSACETHCTAVPSRL